MIRSKPEKINEMLLQVKDIYKSFKTEGGAEPRKVLEGVCLDIEKGDTLSILGPSGSGKSTLLNILGTLDKPDSGEMIFDGQNVGEKTDAQLTRFRNREIGFIFQFHHLLPQCTVLENVLLPVLAVKEREYRISREKVAVELIKSVGLWQQKDQKPVSMSGGECQRVSVIRALVNQPRLLLADEPTGSLDEENAVSVMSLLLELNERFNTALVVVTHSLEIGSRTNQHYDLKGGKLKLKQ